MANTPPINANSFTPPAIDPIKTSYRTPLYLKAIRIIVKIVKKIFNFLCFWQWNKKHQKWTPQQIQMLDEIRDRQFDKVKQKYLRERNIERGNTQPTSNTAPADPAKLKVASIYHDRNFDPSLQAMRNLVANLTENTIECIFEEHLEKTLIIPESTMNEAAGYLKVFSTLLINLGNQAQDQILNKLTIDHSIQGENIIQRSLHKALYWLLSRDDPEEINALLTDLQKEITDKKLTISSKLTDETITGVVQWIQKHTEFEYCEPHSNLYVEHNQLTVDIIIEKSVTFLILRKIDSLNDYLKSHIVGNLPNIVLNLMKINGKILADEFSGRIAEIFENGSLEDYLKRVLHTSTLHTKSYLSAREVVEKRIQKEKNSIKSTEAQLYIDKNAAKEFIQFPSSHPLTHEIYLGQDAGLHHDNWKEIKKRGNTKKVVDDLYDIICAPVIVKLNGEATEVEWLEYLWDRMEFSSEISEFISEIKNFIAHALPQDLEINGNLKKIVVETMKEISISIVNSMIKKALTTGLCTIINNLVEPEKLAFHLNDKLIPLILIPLLRYQVQAVIVNNFDTLSSQLKRLKEPASFDEAKEKLETQLFKLTKEKCPHFEFDANMTMEEIFVKEVTDPIINLIAEQLRDLNLDVTKKNIARLFDNTHSEKANDFSEVIFDLVFKIGEFGGSTMQSLATSFIKDKINDTAGAILKEVTGTDYLLIDIITKNLDEKFGSKENIRKSLFSKPIKKFDQEDPMSKLRGGVHKIACLFYDIIQESAANSSWFTKKGLHFVIGTSPSKIEASINRIFNRLCTDEALNLDLAAKILDITSNSVSYANEAAKLTKLAERKVE